MKLKLKLIAVAAAMASMAGAANAALTAPGVESGSFAITAFNTVTRAWYIRDTGFTLNQFLPSTYTSLSGDGSVTGDKTPNTGLTLNAGNTTSFADASFSTWLTGQTTADIRWFASAYDAEGTVTGNDVVRSLFTSANAAETSSNGQVSNFTASGAGGGLSTLFGLATLSATGTGAPTGFDNLFGMGADALATLGQGVDLYLFSRTVGTGGTANPATGGKFANTTGSAVVTLAANGDFSYVLAGEVAAVPVPAAAWLLGVGLVGLGGAIRRRKAAAELA